MIKASPLVSVIIIFFNAEKFFFEEAIDSIFVQTYDNWELLLVDDGSTNDSTNIALHYAQQYSEKVSYLEHEGHQNRGMSAARNLGIRNAKGQYIGFLDADDVWLPHKLERQVAILNAQPEAAMVWGPTQWWCSWTENPDDVQPDSMRYMGDIPLNKLYKPPSLLILFLRHETDTPATCSALIRRELFEEIGGFEEDFRGMYEDRIFFAKVYLNASVFVYGEYLDRYRQHPDSHWHQLDREKVSFKQDIYLVFLNYLADYLSKQGVNNIEIWQALHKELLPYHHPILYRLQQTKGELKSQIIKFLKFLGKRVLPIHVRYWLGDYIRVMILQKKVKHIFGVKEINCSRNDFIVLCIVINGELYIQSFIEHYLSLGVKHIVFLDKGSIDNTITLASNYNNNVTLLKTNLNFPAYEIAMKKYLLKYFAKNKSYTFAEIDKFLDYNIFQKEKYNLSEIH